MPATKTRRGLDVKRVKAGVRISTQECTGQHVTRSRAEEVFIRAGPRDLEICFLFRRAKCDPEHTYTEW